MSSRRALPPSSRSIAAVVLVLGHALVLTVGLAFAQTSPSPGPSQAVQIEGTLEILHEDSAAGSRYRYFLNSTSGRYSLQFAGDEPTHLLTGARIRVHGIKRDTTLALAGGSKNVQTVSAAPALSTVGEQRTLVMLVNFADNTSQPWSRDEVNQAIFGTMSAFISENSYGATWVTGDVTDWFTISLSSSVCDVSTLASQAQQAAQAAGWTPGNYSRWIYAFPHNVCGFGGASYIGGSPSQSWLNGDVSLRFAGHEFGHGLGLWHSHSMDCGAIVIGPSCTTNEYGDVLDIMGTSSSGHYDAFQKERLGWLGSAASPITTVLTDSTYTLEAYEIAGSAPKALKILKSTDPSTGQRTWYYVESRQAIGFDAALAAQIPNVTAGVMIHTGSESSGDSSYLLDMTPESASWDWRDAALVVGQSFNDPEAGVTITTEWVTGTGAAVTVRFDTAVTASTASTAVTVATDQPSYTSTQQVSITTTVMSGGSPVAGASVTLTVTKASGAVVMANATTGSDGTAVYKLRLKKQDPIGTYQVGAVARTSGQSGSAATTFTVR